TTNDTAADVDPLNRVGSAGVNTAVNECVPTANADVDMLAVPPATATGAPRLLLPSLNCTEPAAAAEAARAHNGTPYPTPTAPHPPHLPPLPTPLRISPHRPRRGRRPIEQSRASRDEPRRQRMRPHRQRRRGHAPRTTSNRNRRTKVATAILELHRTRRRSRRSEKHTSELHSLTNLARRLLLD